MMSSDVKLLRTQSPVFPDRCVCCMAEEPGNTATIKQGTVRLWNLLFLSSGQKYEVTFPICRACAPRFKRRRGIGGVFLVLLGAAGLLGARWFFADLQAIHGLWIDFAGMAAGVVPAVIWGTLVPPAFDVTPLAKSVDYEFSNRDYAKLFLGRNEGATSDDF